MKNTNLITTNFKHVAPEQVKDFILNQFSNLEIKRSINTPGKIMFNLVEKLAQHPLFFYNGSTAARLSFSSWYGLLDLRDNTYTNQLERDLYLLHELNHMATLNYTKMSDEEWRSEHIRNEKASSFWSEALVYFEYPSLFEPASATFPLWIAPYFTDELALIPGISNHILYAQSPEFCSALLFQEFLKISIKEHHTLSPIELRSRKYDYLTETWCDANQVLQTCINQHFVEYRGYLADNRYAEAIALHEKWLNTNMSERGVLFDNKHVLRAKVNSNEIFKLAKQEERFKTLTLKYNIPYSISLQGYLDKIVAIMQSEEAKGNITQTPLVAPTKQLIHDAGITNTIYSLFTRPARAVANQLRSKNNLQDQLYGIAESRIQDGFNKIFTEQYKNWTKDLVIGLDDFPHSYPTAGSSEALRESIIELAAVARNKGDIINIHTFQGEYEGVRSYASSVSIPMIEHANRNLDNLLNASNLRAKDIFYISYPSSIDGNIWPDLNKFLDLMHTKGVRVLLDLTYVGAYIGKQTVMANHPAIECVYFSLSKSFGVYYHRVGGVFSRNPLNLLVGNKWFKNTFSMALGTDLMQQFRPNDIASFYSRIQQALTWYVNSKLNLKLQPSDVFLIAQQKISPAEHATLPATLKMLCRPTDNSYILRACLQPLLDYLTNDFHRTFPLFNFEIAPRSVNKLINKVKSCSPETPNIKAIDAQELLLAGWEMNLGLSKSFSLSNAQISRFLEEILIVANKHNHHPRITFTENKCVISLITHATNSVTEVDAMLAKKIDLLYSSYNKNEFKVLTFSAAKNDACITELFSFKNFNQAFDFAKNIHALVANADRKHTKIEIDWGVCSISAPPKYIATAQNIYKSLDKQMPDLKYKARL